MNGRFGFCNLQFKIELFLSPESHKHLKSCNATIANLKIPNHIS